MDQITEQAIGVLKGGADRLCDYADEQWQANKYRMTHEECQQNLKEWRQIRGRCRELVNRMKKKIKDGEEGWM